MPRLTARAFTLFAMSLLVFGLPLYAQAAPQGSATRRQPGPQRGVCQSTEVRLRGDLTPLVTCLDSRGALGPQGAVGPAIGRDDGCNGADLALYSDSSFAGSKICFRGAGYINLGDYTYQCFFGICSSWNDVASSYATGCSGGIFFKDAHWTGTQQPFGAYKIGNFDDQAGRLPNDSLSSLRLYSNC